MRPITIVKRFLKGETPSIPLPPGIDHEVASNPSTARWLLISQSPTRQQFNQIISTKEAECQTLSASQPFYSRPQACIKRSWGLSGDTPLPAPSFLPKSKAPKLDYEGLQPPKLHFFATSLLSNPLSPLQQTAPFLKPTPKSLPSPTSFRNTYCITVNDFSEPERARSQPHDVFYETHFSSKLFCEIHKSEFLGQRIDRITDSLGTGGLMAYLQIWNHWARWCQCHQQIPAEAPLSLLLDYLHASDHLKRPKDSKPWRTIKALRWMAPKLDLPLNMALQRETVSDFLKSRPEFHLMKQRQSHLLSWQLGS